MAFGSTITITVNAVAKVLNRINQDNYGSEYSLLTATDSWNLKIRHSTDSPDADGMTMLRHNIYIEHVVYATPSTNQTKETFTATLRAGKYDGTTAEAHLASAMATYMLASSSAVINDLVVGLN